MDHFIECAWCSRLYDAAAEDAKNLITLECLVGRVKFCSVEEMEKWRKARRSDAKPLVARTVLNSGRRASPPYEDKNQKSLGR